MSNRLANYKAKLAEVQSQYLAEMPLLQYPACLKAYVKANKLYKPEKKARAKVPMTEATKAILRDIAAQKKAGTFVPMSKAQIKGRKILRKANTAVNAVNYVNPASVFGNMKANYNARDFPSVPVSMELSTLPMVNAFVPRVNKDGSINKNDKKKMAALKKKISL